MPPFAAVRDARDFVAPCGTCSFIAHRKCLLDWFNSVPASKITRTYVDGHTPPSDSLNVSFLSRWLGVQGFYTSVDPPQLVPDAMAVILLTPCPQCKQPVMFRTRPLPAVAAAAFARAAVVDLVQYTGALMGVTGAASGIVTVVYVGLARCGAAMLDALVPPALLGPLLLRTPAPFSLVRWAAAAAPQWDQYKQHLIVLFPVALYRARSHPVVADRSDTVTSLLLEAWVCNYLLALGGHRLARALWAGARQAAERTGQNPWRALHYFGPAQLLAKIDWWDPHHMVAAMIPARWLYAAVHRVTFNRWYFDLTLAARPRDIANTLSEHEAEALLDCSAAHSEARQKVARRWHTRSSGGAAAMRVVRDLVRDGLLWAVAASYAKLQCRKLWACVRHDYSNGFFLGLALVCAVTTVAWPFVAADVGRLVYRLVLSRLMHNVPKDRLVLLLNLVAMVAVAVAKELVGCYLSAEKARQIADMAVVYLRPESVPDPEAAALPQMPGAYRDGVITQGTSTLDTSSI